MPCIAFSLVRERLPLARVLELLDFVPVAGRGVQVRGLCPLHGGAPRRSRSFAAHLERNVWHCFHCGQRGNALDLWVAVTRQPVYEAALDLCQRLGIEVPRLHRNRAPVRQRSPPCS